MTLGEKLYTLRTKQNMTQEQLAEKLQVYFQMGIRCHTSRSWKIKIPGRILPCITRRIIR